MADCSEHKNPLVRNGTSQLQRLLPGMDKKIFARADDKTFEDWIVFANQFAAFINYYNPANTISGNWEPFFSSDISAQLGIAAIQDIDQYRLGIKERFDFIKNDDNKLLLTDIGIKLNEVFSAVLTLSKALDDYFIKLPEDALLKNSILNGIKLRLKPALYRLIAYYKAAELSGYTDHSSLSNWKILNKRLTDSKQILDIDGLSDLWFDKSLFPDWATYKNSIADDKSIFNNPLTAFADVFLSIEHAANHNLFTGIFDIYLNVYAKIIKDAEAELLTTLEKYNAHAPHYALFLAFLKLFRYNQAHINTITQRHLDFYYKEVLRLKPRPAEANKVHILGELAKQTNHYLLPQGTGVKAGKDHLNKDVVYSLNNDTVLSKAKVAQLKTFYKADTKDTIFVPGTATIKQDNTGRVFASPVANSADGIGGELTSANKEWQPYVHRIYKETELESIAMPKAKLGFALASHYLYLTEGERKVFIRLVMNPLTALSGKNIECYLSTEKEWYKVTSPVISSSGSKLSDGITNCAEISFTIPGSDPSIVNYNPAIHGDNFNVALPVLKVYLVHDDNKLYEYDLLKDIIVTQVEIRVEVGMNGVYNQKGLKNLSISNGFGALDGSKPFQVFGPQPEAGDRLVIGSKEIFSKKNTTLELNMEWKGLPAHKNYISYAYAADEFPNIKIETLEEGIWKSIGDDELFEATGVGLLQVMTNRQLSIAENSIKNSVINYDQDYPIYDIASNKGFVSIRLMESFGHKQYLKNRARYLLERSPGIPDTIFPEPVEPYTPTLQSFYISYSAYSTAKISNASAYAGGEIKFFHLYPFGSAEQHKYLSGEAIYLLPQFKHAAEGITVAHTGEFYIGIEKGVAGEAVNILFQLMEGTSIPTIPKPDDHIHWSYLSNNTWIDFEKGEYSDNTLALVQSAIVSFTIPKKATDQNTLLPAGFVWLRAAIKEAAGAVCKLISVDAQASVATFSDNNNAPDFLDSALPAGTISKLKLPDAAIKKLKQPYPSFGGRPKENEDHFYIRVSERLRHKARAIMIWDYEHLVLEAFPEIYKVKCLNHTQIEDGVYNEVKPGYVSIITIPSTQNRNDADPLKPYTQQSILTNIEKFLRKRTSCFVQLRASQPQFEEIRMEFSLKLHQQYIDFNFYANMLKTEITQFLSPWAFNNTSKIDFGGKIYKSVLINFIEERYYVDFITDVFMYVKVDDISVESGDRDEIIASTARSILVSAPASTHVIHEITGNEQGLPEECPGSTRNRTENHNR